MLFQLLNYRTMKQELRLNNIYKLMSYFRVNRTSLNYTEESIKLYRDVTSVYCEVRMQHTVWGKLQYI
jgi:hypothetical protein